MYKKKITEKFKENLKYNLIRELYVNSRISSLKLAKKYRVPYHIVNNLIKEMEQKYQICYTLSLNTQKLGLSSCKVVTVKFSNRPTTEELKKELSDDIFVQHAYLGKGDFDLIIYFVGLSELDFVVWEWTLRANWSKYKPEFKSSTISDFIIGYLPLSNKLISKFNSIKKDEKKILMLLNENSRIKKKDIAKLTNLTEIQVTRRINSLVSKKIIHKFTLLVQNPEKKLIIASFIKFKPNENHPKNLKKIILSILTENLNSITSNYSVISNISGYYDLFLFNNFLNNELIDKYGRKLWEDSCIDEDPISSESIITETIYGKMLLHPDSYNYYKKYIKEIDTENYINERNKIKKGKFKDEILESS